MVKSFEKTNHYTIHMPRNILKVKIYSIRSGSRKESDVMSYILQTHHLSKSIDGKALVTDVSMGVRKGEIYGFPDRSAVHKKWEIL